MACGCPVVTSYGSATEEVASGAAYLVNPESKEEIRDAIVYMLSNNSNHYSDLGINNANSFSWVSTRNLTTRCVQSILEG